MSKTNSQLRPTLALAKASIISMLRSPTATVFSLLFPIIFIVVFGSLVDSTLVQLKLYLAPGCDTSNIVYQSIRGINNITITTDLSPADAEDYLQKGRITAILDIKKDTLGRFQVNLKNSPSTAKSSLLLQTQLKNAIGTINQSAFPNNPTIATLNAVETPGRVYRKIDFILPGQLGFSLLMAGVFSSAFLLFHLRKGLILKRLSATPISRANIIAGETLSRLSFHLASFIIMIAIGYYIFGFTLVNGFATFLEMLVFSLLGLIIFMGIGFIISGSVQNESAVTPIANTLTLPQVLLCGLFFPVENYPHWLQSFCNILPLTYLVDGLRKIGFEGIHMWQMPVQMIGLSIWALVITVVSVLAFKWE